MKHISATFALVAALACAPSGFAQVLAPPHDVLQLSASASAEVALDTISIVLSTAREGADPASVQAALKQALDAALAEAKKAAKPGHVDVRTGAFSIQPRHGPKGQIAGWIGSAELVVEGKDVAAIAQLAGRIPALTVARVGHALSREAREKVETDVAAQAIARFRAKAAEWARLFGYGGYAIREVNVATDQPPHVPIVRERMMAAAADQALPVELGKGTVTAIVSGSVQMVK
jgi:predicted secreted protein